MSTIAEAYVSLVPSFKGGSSGISKALGDSPDKAGVVAGNRFTGAFGGVVGKLAGIAAIAGVGVAIGATLKAGLDRVTTIQNASVSLTTILGSQAKAADFTAQILKTVQGTPFSLDQFVNAGRNLVAFGVDAKKVPGYLTAIGDAAAASGKGAEGVNILVTALGQIQAKGRVQGDELLQLSEAGIPALAILANHFGVTTTAMSSMVSKGAVPAKEAIQALTDGIENGTTGIAGVTPKLGGQMIALRQTFTGALGGFKTALARLGAGVVGPLLDPMTAGLNKATSIVDKATAIVGPAVKSVLGSVSSAASGISAVLAPVSTDVKLFFAVLSGAPIGALGPYAGEVINFADKVRGGFDAVRSTLAAAKTDVALFMGVFKTGAVQSPLGPFAADVINLAAGAREAFDSIKAGLSTAFDAAKPQVLAVMAATLDSLKATASTLKPYLDTLFAQLAPVLPALLPPLLTLAEALNPVSLILHALLPVLPVLAQAVGEVAVALANALVPILPTVAQLMADVVKVMSVGLQDALIAVVPPLAQLLVVLAPLAPYLLGIWAAFEGYKAATSAVSAVSEFGTKIGPALIGVAGKANTARDAVVGFGSKAAEVARSGASLVSTLAQTAAGFVKTGAAAAASAVKTLAVKTAQVGRRRSYEGVGGHSGDL